MASSGNVIRRLFESFDELERSIATAKKILTRKDPIPFSLLKRVTQYEEILGKQRKLAQELCRHVVEENWEEVSRHTKMINAFTALVYNDAMALTSQIIRGESEFEEQTPEEVDVVPATAQVVTFPGKVL